MKTHNTGLVADMEIGLLFPIGSSLVTPSGIAPRKPQNSYNPSIEFQAHNSVSSSDIDIPAVHFSHHNFSTKDILLDCWTPLRGGLSLL